MKLNIKRKAILLAFSVLAVGSFASAATKLTEVQIQTAKLKKSGVPVVKCPSYIANQRTGLYTSLNPANTICLNNLKSSKAKKALKRNDRFKLILDGKLRGRPFQTLDRQEGNEGDVETGLFTLVNYPVGIFFSLNNADYSATYSLQIRDGTFGRVELTAQRGSVPAAGWVNWLTPGKHFFKINAQPDKEANQPTFRVEMRYMDQYSGTRVSRGDISFADIALKPCPTYLYDIYDGKMFTIDGFVCTDASNLVDAGFTAAPYNLNTGLYLAQELNPDVLFGAGQGFPFRIRRPTLLGYQVDDPAVSEGRTGSTDINVINLTTGRVVSNYHVEGTVNLTQTSLNIPGDYYISVTTRPADRKKFGEIDWQVFLEASD